MSGEDVDASLEAIPFAEISSTQLNTETSFRHIFAILSPLASDSQTEQATIAFLVNRSKLANHCCCPAPEASALYRLNAVGLLSTHARDLAMCLLICGPHLNSI